MSLLHTLSRLFLPLALTLLWSSAAFSWWDMGHRDICRMAMASVQETTRQEIGHLLERPLDTQCDWADRVKKQRPETRPWHYFNIPPGTRHIEGVPRPPEGDVVSALISQAQRLSTLRAREPRREALLWVAHLIGDLHQPLHLGYADDLGGNTYRMTLPPDLAADLSEDRDNVSMHAVWDGLIQRYGVHTNGGIETPEMPEVVVITEPATAVLRWANETLTLVNDPAVHYLEGTRLTVLNRSYLKQNAPVVTLQLERAAARLAALLDWAFRQEE